MHRIDSATARQNLNGAGKNGFHDNADLPNQDATYLTPAWCNTVQEEVANVIEGFGGALDKLDNKQLLNILTATFAKNTALQNAVDDYIDKFAQQGSRILAVENRIYEDTKVVMSLLPLLISIRLLKLQYIKAMARGNVRQKVVVSWVTQVKRIAQSGLKLTEIYLVNMITS